MCFSVEWHLIRHISMKVIGISQYLAITMHLLEHTTNLSATSDQMRIEFSLVRAQARNARCIPYIENWIISKLTVKFWINVPAGINAPLTWLTGYIKLPNQSKPFFSGLHGSMLRLPLKSNKDKGSFSAQVPGEFIRPNTVYCMWLMNLALLQRRACLWRVAYFAPTILSSRTSELHESIQNIVVVSCD